MCNCFNIPGSFIEHKNYFINYFIITKHEENVY